MMNRLRAQGSASPLLTAVRAGAVAAQELKVGVQNMAPWLDPGRDFSNVGSQFYFNAFDPLIGKDHSKAESVWRRRHRHAWKQVSATVMELKIRHGVKFHNGDTMTADDVVFSLDRIINSDLPAVRRCASATRCPTSPRSRRSMPTPCASRREKPEPLFETLLNAQQTMIVPKKYIDGPDRRSDEVENSDYEAFALKPVGTGPYKITEFVPNQRIVYERLDEFWGDKAPFRKVTLRRIPELSARITALKNGEVDIVTNVPPDQLKVIADDAEAQGRKRGDAAVPRRHLQHPASEDGQAKHPPGAVPTRSTARR